LTIKKGLAPTFYEDAQPSDAQPSVEERMTDMLVLTRRLQEKIVFPSIQTEVQVLEMKGDQVRLGIEAPPRVAVLREELTGPQENWGANEPGTSWPPAGSDSLREVRHRLRNRLNEVGLNLAVLRQQLQKGQAANADSTISRVENDLQQLRQELEEELTRIGAGHLQEASSAVAAEEEV
jgi:carbon storage regulator CsrA